MANRGLWRLYDLLASLLLVWRGIAKRGQELCCGRAVGGVGASLSWEFVAVMWHKARSEYSF